MTLGIYSASVDFHTQYLQRLADEARQGFGEGCDRFIATGGGFSGRSRVAVVAAQPTLIDALAVTAHEHGFADWTAMEARLKDLEHGRAKDPRIGFYRAVEDGNVEGFEANLAVHPDDVNIVASTRKSPLHKASSAAMAELLLVHGADPAQEANVPGSVPSCGASRRSHRRSMPIIRRRRTYRIAACRGSASRVACGLTSMCAMISPAK